MTSEQPEEDFDPIEWERLPLLVREGIAHLPDDLRERAEAAEPGSTWCLPLGNGWFRFSVGFTDPVIVGELHVSSLRKDMSPGGRN